MKFTMRILAGSLLIALAPLTQAQTTGGELDTQVRVFDATAANRGQTQVAQKIAANFVNLAGSEDNALALVNALRSGTDATLKTPTATTGTGTSAGTGTSTSTTIDPPTGKMGWGNVKIALGLAQDALLRAGITKPTAEQLQAALNGGAVTRADGTTVTLKGVLQMRADGMGWGQIAQAGGTKVGPVVSSLKSTQAELAKLPKATTSGTTTTAAAAKSKGVTTAAGASSTSTGKGSSKGITTATGATSGSASRGLVTADGATSAHQPKGNGYGRGVVTAAGGGAGVNVSASGKPTQGAGVVTGSGAGAASVSTANGNAGGNGKGNAGGNGKGKGG